MRNIGCHFQWPSSLWQPRQCWVNVSHSSGAVKITIHITQCLNDESSKFIFKKRTYLPFFKFFLVSRAMQLYFSPYTHSLSSPKPNHFCIDLKLNWIVFLFVTSRKECDLLLKHSFFLLVFSWLAFYLRYLTDSSLI